MKTEMTSKDQIQVIRDTVELIAGGHLRSAIINGPADPGKSHLVFDQLKKLHFQEGIEYVILDSFDSPEVLYFHLFINRNLLTVIENAEWLLDENLDDDIQRIVTNAVKDSYHKCHFDSPGMTLNVSSLEESDISDIENTADEYYSNNEPNSLSNLNIKIPNVFSFNGGIILIASSSKSLDDNILANSFDMRYHFE